MLCLSSFELYSRWVSCKGVEIGEEENRRFFHLALRARSRALADVFEKNEKKKEQRLCTGYDVSYTPLHLKVNPFKS